MHFSFCCLYGSYILIGKYTIYIQHKKLFLCIYDHHIYFCLQKKLKSDLIFINLITRIVMYYFYQYFKID